MPEHIMNLKPSPFAKIQAGTKTIELRLYDKKRQRIEVGDIITFIENCGLRLSAPRFAILLHFLDFAGIL